MFMKNKNWSLLNYPEIPDSSKGGDAGRCPHGGFEMFHRKQRTEQDPIGNDFDRMVKQLPGNKQRNL